MNNAILFDFLVDRENKKIKVKRSFDAGLSLVWQAWTDAEILDQWWAPRPWKNKTISMDFREGGRWFYAMSGPDNNQTYWSLVNFRTIVYHKHFTSDSAFCNEKAEVNPDFPSNQWEIQFNSEEEQTVVHVTLSLEKLEHLDQLIQMGFKEGFTQGLEQLDALLKEQKQ
jgi:PhnB protein